MVQAVYVEKTKDPLEQQSNVLFINLQQII
jgi:hypothetical protein